MKRRIAVGTVVVVGGVAAYLLFAGGDEDGELVASGTVEATEANLGFQMPGRITAVHVREGDRVSAGQELARLDAAELLAAVAVAEAQADVARAVLEEMREGGREEEVAQARATVAAAAVRVEDTARDLSRARTLFEEGARPRAMVDKAATAHAVAEAELVRAREALRALETGARAEQLAAQAARVAAAEAAIRRAEAGLANAVVRAPFAGLVTIRHGEPGETVQPGQPVVTVMDPGDRWVRIYIPEDRIGAVSVGQAAAIRSDTYPERSFEGRVVHIAREAEFTPRNVQTREERVKLVYAVRVAIAGDPELVLKPGIPADVRLATPEVPAAAPVLEGPG